jgi:hypothetical protein
MSRLPLGWSVVWSVPLVALILGAELAALATVGLAAATPPVSSVSFSYPTSRGSSIVAFSPTAEWGSRSLEVDLAAGNHCSLGYPPSPPGFGEPVKLCTAVVTVRGCSDTSCSALGTFQAPGELVGRIPLQVTVPAQTLAFLITLTGGDATVLVVQMVWVDGAGWLQGFTSLSSCFAVSACAGLVVAVVSLAAGKVRGIRWSREHRVVYAGLPPAPASPKRGA